jgi:mRNA interferase RelE/StbE
LWSVEFDKAAAKSLERLSTANKERVRKYIDNRLLRSADPRVLGSALTGSLSGLWRYRVGDIRLVAKIEDDKLVIFVVQIGHRSQVYRP